MGGTYKGSDEVGNHEADETDSARSGDGQCDGCRYRDQQQDAGSGRLTAWAVRSPLAKASRIGPHSIISTVSSNAASMTTGTESQLARANDPRVQNMTERAVSGESEEKMMRLVRA